MKNWKQLRDRLAHMGPEERRERLRQERNKWQDTAFSRLGFDFTRNSRNSMAVSSGKFFFDPGSVDSTLGLVRQRIPAKVEHIPAQAQKVLQHRFDLLGYEGLDFGNPIDWHLDPVHGRGAPKKIFHRVRYLDFQEVGDSKVTWELNRHQHLVTLAKAFRLTGDRRYADEILRQWREWWTHNPYPIGINWASSLEVSFRSLSWLWTYHLLAGGPGIPDFRDEWLRGLALHGRHIERYLSTYFSPNTHLLGEGVALFFLGVLCPELSAAGRWKQLGWDIVLREAKHQVRSDGFHFEQSTYYHVYAIDFFLHAAVLASVNNIPLPADFEATLEKMLQALFLLGRAGAPPRFGDDDGGRLFEPRRNRGEHLLDPLATGAILFHRGDFKFAVGDLREETLWLLGREGVKIWDELEASPPDMDSAECPDAGFYLMTVKKPATQLAVDAGPLGTQSGGHGHTDALSVCLNSQGRTLLIDPGTSVYIDGGPDRDRFRGTSMHNTLRVDGTNQAEITGPFSWRTLTQAKAESWVQARNFDLLAASHNGYQNLPQPVRHKRWVISLKNGIFLVRDIVEGQGTHSLELSWFLGPELQLVEEGVYRLKGASNGLAILAVEKHGWAEEVRRESWSPAYGQTASTTAMKFGTVASLPVEIAFMLVTLEEVHGRPGSLTKIDLPEKNSGVAAYRYADAENAYEFFFAAAGASWQVDSVSSDAEFVCRRRALDGSGQSVYLVNGSHAAFKDGIQLRCQRHVAWSEVHFNRSQRSYFSSDPDSQEEKVEQSAEREDAVTPNS